MLSFISFGIMCLCLLTEWEEKHLLGTIVSSNESYVIFPISLSSFLRDQFCLNLSGKKKSSILLNTIKCHRTMAGNGLPWKLIFKTWVLDETSSLRTPLLAKTCKIPCTSSVFQKLCPFVSADVRAFPTFRPISKSTHLRRFYYNYSSSK